MKCMKKTSKQQIMKLKFFQKQNILLPYSPKISMFYNNHMFAKNDHLKTVL